MNLNKLFRLLVLGGAVLGSASSCGPEEDPGVTSPGDNTLTSSGGGAEDAGVQNPGSGGGTAAPGGGSGGGSAQNGGGVGFW
jgi:hypothetical protein